MTHCTSPRNSATLSKKNDEHMYDIREYNETDKIHSVRITRTPMLLRAAVCDIDADIEMTQSYRY